MISLVNPDQRAARPRCASPLSAAQFGATATAHPFATRAALSLLEQGGSAVDAAIAAQAMIATVLPDAAGLGGDVLALVRSADAEVTAVNGTGPSPSVAPAGWSTSGGASITVPGLVDGWAELHDRWGVLPLAACLTPAIEVAEHGFALDESLCAARDEQRQRLILHGAGSWALLGLSEGNLWRQPELARLLAAIGEHGRGAFYEGDAAAAVATAARAEGGSLSEEDLAAHRTSFPDAVSVDWNGGRLWVQPPPSQGILLAMAAQWVNRAVRAGDVVDAHALVEATEAAFAYRDAAADDPTTLLGVELDVDTQRAGRRGGPRGYLHTAGVAVADRSGLVISSLVSVFDDFGSGVFVPELGIVLNNRAAGFTAGGNAPRPGARPVHTLAPALLVDAEGDPLALATPGADGQVQTLLQVLTQLRSGERPIADVLSDPRWRSQDGRLLIEAGHSDADRLAELGHRLIAKTYGEALFGAVVAAGLSGGEPFAAADPRRSTTKGAR